MLENIYIEFKIESNICCIFTQIITVMARKN